jgi:1,4-alpha-glucan branching enzyme
VALAFETTRGDANEQIFNVYAPRARRVELMGDFTDWHPVELSREADGRWTVTLPVASGAHRLNIRVDSGDWIVPPGVTPVKDEFNGVVGTVIIGLDSRSVGTRSRD